jgi:signal peptidase I
MSNKPRKWWIAGLLSLLEPGLGQLYNGQARKGLLILALPFLIISSMILCLNAKNMVFFLCAFILLVLTYYVTVIGDAILIARKLRNEYHLKPYNRIIIYIIIVVIVFAASTTLYALVNNNYIKAYRIPTASMEPTLLVGDHILIDRRFSSHIQNRGDLIVFEYPVDQGKDFIKRIVAVGGDNVEIRDKALFVNGKHAKEVYVIHKHTEVLPANQNQRDNYGLVTVPNDSFFVLGDNRDESYDSRFFGFVRRSSIKGIVTSIYWSWDHTNSTVRWDRIGAEVR